MVLCCSKNNIAHGSPCATSEENTSNAFPRYCMFKCVHHDSCLIDFKFHCALIASHCRSRFFALSPSLKARSLPGLYFLSKKHLVGFAAHLLRQHCLLFSAVSSFCHCQAPHLVLVIFIRNATNLFDELESLDNVGLTTLRPTLRSSHHIKQTCCLPTFPLLPEPALRFFQRAPVPSRPTALATPPLPSLSRA